MPVEQGEVDFIRNIFQLREDCFAIENIQPFMPEVIDHIVSIGCDLWDKDALSSLAHGLRSGEITLTSSAEKGIKGLHGEHPIHGAMIKIVEKNAVEREKRSWLLAYVIDAAYLWREEIKNSEYSKISFENESVRLTYKSYIKNLEAACKVIRKIDTEWLDLIKGGHDDSLQLQKTLKRLSSDPESQGERYFQQLERFFAYALNSRRPRKKSSRRAGSSRKVATVQRRKPIDEPPDDGLDAPRASKLIFSQPDEDDDAQRQAGLSRSEDQSSADFIQIETPVASSRGDSSFQAVYRTRAQRQHQDKAAQLLPSRWEQLSSYDIYHLARQLRGQFAADKKLICLVGVMLATGRDLDSALHAHVVRDLRQVPEQIKDHTLYIKRAADEWYADVFRPEKARKASGQWPEAMRPTLERLSLPLFGACHNLIEPHARRVGMHVRKRSRPLFSEQVRERLEGTFAALLSTVNRKTGARLSAKRLGLHLFNVLNMGEADLAATCLISARMPTFGQQSPLYYYAPAVSSLAQRYSAAMQRLETPVAIALNNDHATGIAQRPIAQAGSDRQYVGSHMVPQDHYVIDLVKQLVKQQHEMKKYSGHFEAWAEFHNLYTAYTVAMLMFCTGYRSIRDPLPRLTHISLSRQIIVIADKTNDHQSNARFLPLPPVMVEQFCRYLKHRRAVLSRLQIYLGEDWDSPFCFLDMYGKPQSVTPGRLENHLQWPHSPPLNINRHYLHTQLKERGCSAELVDAFMGHWDMGQEPWAKHSTLCPRAYRQHITSRVEEMMLEQGWKIIEGVAL
ncbi:hypothetical protein [Halomonas piscis]|uniref:hypothetical protein n=1 Tax=Halomonas piscis TaxID=3031727 RepID=UPI0028A21245|nr:hypothetical protein [Halomonas piscis]